MSHDAQAEANKKRSNRRRHRNTAASNAPKPVTTPVQTPPSRTSQLLAQLAAAQSSTPSPSTNIAPPRATSTPKQMDKTKRSKEVSVAARMVRQQPPPATVQSKQRTRHVSSSSALKHDAQSRGPKIPEDVLDNISFRFILNIPDSERFDEIRICFQIELAHWFYIDYYVGQQGRSDCKEIGMRDFLKQIFAHNDFLQPMYKRADEILDKWREYKSTVPTYGAILLDPTLNYILLVQGFYASKNSWGFPKGKVNESESPRECAVREVLEETGFDFGEHSEGNEYRIQKLMNDTMIRLYVVNDVPPDYKFEPKTRCEIRQMKWFNIWDLPLDRNDQVATHKGFPAKHFYSVVPFVQDIRNYVAREQRKRGGEEGKERKTSKSVLTHKSSAFTRVEKKTAEERQEESIISGLHSHMSVPVPTTYNQPANETVFKPLTEMSGAPPGSNLANILASSAASTHLPVRQQKVSSLAHPVPIRALCDRPVYVAPKELPTPAKASATSLEPSSWTSFSNSSCSASHIEDVLNRMLFKHEGSEKEEERWTDEVDEEIHECIATNTHQMETPLAVVEMLRRSSIAGSMNGRVSRDSLALNPPSLHPFPLSPHSFPVQLVPAWSDFKLNKEAILDFFAPFPS